MMFGAWGTIDHGDSARGVDCALVRLRVRTGRAVGRTPSRMADRCDASGVVKPRLSCLPAGPNDAS